MTHTVNVAMLVRDTLACAIRAEIMMRRSSGGACRGRRSWRRLGEQSSQEGLSSTDNHRLAGSLEFHDGL